MTLEYISHCGSAWMVGIDGYSTLGKGTGGRFRNTPFVVFGSDELPLPTPKTSRCPKCGKRVRVRVSKSQPPAPV